MKSINRWMYGPTAEERVREWQGKLRTETRKLDREIMNVSEEEEARRRPTAMGSDADGHSLTGPQARPRYAEDTFRAQAAG
jgi:charged multivesicular body protein 3